MVRLRPSRRRGRCLLRPTRARKWLRRPPVVLLRPTAMLSSTSSPKDPVDSKVTRSAKSTDPVDAIGAEEAAYREIELAHFRRGWPSHSSLHKDWLEGQASYQSLREEYLKVGRLANVPLPYSTNADPEFLSCSVWSIGLAMGRSERWSRSCSRRRRTGSRPSGQLAVRRPRPSSSTATRETDPELL
jgi:hypothetical protein